MGTSPSRAWRALSTKGSFSNDFAIFLLRSVSMRFTNREWGRRVTPSLSLSIFGIESGHQDNASGAQSLLPGTCISLRS